MLRDASQLAHRLTREAEAVCRHYLSNGRREGRYWLVGDVLNTPGRSMFVRLKGPDMGRGAAGKWTDAATGEHGDLLDVIRESCGLLDFSDVADEARRFLSLPHSTPKPSAKPARAPAQAGSPEAARRLIAISQPIAETLAEKYLRNRGITALHEGGALRFHPRCYYRPDEFSPAEIWPAMIARVTDLNERITGVRRAVVVVEGATVRPFVAETTTMIVIGLILSVFGIGFLCWLLFTLAVYALPFFAGITMGLAAYHSGAGIIGALVVGFVAGAGTLLAGQAAFAAVKLPVLRTAIAILFAAPAAVAGFFMTLGLSRIGVPSLIWSDIFAVIGAIFVGGAAFVRIAAMATSPAAGQNSRGGASSATDYCRDQRGVM